MITVARANNPILIGAAAGSGSNTCSRNNRQGDTERSALRSLLPAGSIYR